MDEKLPAVAAHHPRGAHAERPSAAVAGSALCTLTGLSSILAFYHEVRLT